MGFHSRNCDLPLAASEPVELASLFHHPSTSSGSGYFSQPFDRLRGRILLPHPSTGSGSGIWFRPVGFHSRNCDLLLSDSEPVELASLYPSPFDRLRVRILFSTLRQAQGPDIFTLSFDKLRDRNFYCGQWVSNLVTVIIHSRPVSLSN